MKTIVLKHTNTRTNVENNQIDEVDVINALISGLQAEIFFVCQQLEVQIAIIYLFRIRYSRKIYSTQQNMQLLIGPWLRNASISEGVQFDYSM